MLEELQDRRTQGEQGIRPGSVVRPRKPLASYRSYDQSSASLRDRNREFIFENALVIACIREPFSELTGIYITLIISSVHMGWVFMNVNDVEMLIEC